MKKLELIIFILLTISFSASAQYYGYNLDYIVIDDTVTNPIEGITPINEDDFTQDTSLDIINWNVSWMGAPQMNDYEYGTRSEQINGIAAKLVELNADVYALQEVVVDTINGNALEDLLEAMDSIAGTNKYKGVYSKFYSYYWEDYDSTYPPQCLAYVWNTDVVTVNKDSALLQEEASYANFGYGRLPYLLDANVTLNGKTQRYMFINIHLKAKTGYSDQRASSMELLKKLLYANFADNNVVLLGDYNVSDDLGALGEIRDWGMYADNDGDGITDFVHAAGDKTNGIEHILLSNELFDELAYTPECYRNETISGTVSKWSDHSAYETRLYIYEESGNIDPGNNSIYGKYNLTMTKSDYQIIVDYVKSDPELSALDNSNYDDSEYYFGASAYYSDFSTSSGYYYSGFSSWQEAVKAAISLVLLPSKYPNAEVDDSIYRVTFDTYNGSNATYTFNFVCTKSAPDPEFEYTTRTAVDEFSLAGHIKIYPNPATDYLNIASEYELNTITVSDYSGKRVISKKGLSDLKVVLNISGLSKGIYFVQLTTCDGETLSKIIKK